MLRKKDLKTPEVNRKLSKPENTNCELTELVTTMPDHEGNHHSVTRSKGIK